MAIGGGCDRGRRGGPHEPRFNDRRQCRQSIVRVEKKCVMVYRVESRKRAEQSAGVASVAAIVLPAGGVNSNLHSMIGRGVGSREWGVGNGIGKPGSQFSYFQFPTPHSLLPTPLLSFPGRLSSLRSVHFGVFSSLSLPPPPAGQS